MKRLLLTVLLASASLLGAAEEGVWVGLSVASADADGKMTESVYMGRISREDLAALREGRNRDGFIHVTGVCWREETPQGASVVVSYTADSLDDTDEVYFRAQRIERIVLLKGDPRQAVPKPAGAAPAKVPATEGY